jgi:hypothetical protein
MSAVCKRSFFLFQSLNKCIVLYQQNKCKCTYRGRDSSVGMATRYRLDGVGIESHGGEEFSHPFRPALGPTQPPVQWVRGLSRGKAAEAWH